MRTKRSAADRLTSLLLVAVMLFAMVPLTAFAAGADSVRIADPSTMDSWREYFPTSGEISTENAGGVWTDKSVFTDASAFDGLIEQDDPNSFLVALSAMAANMSITGMSNVPTDTMLVLDVSGSMNSDAGNNDVAEDLVAAANDSIQALLETNPHNRVGVVLYSGPNTVGGSASDGDAIVILPLGRYTTGTNGEYLSYGTRTGRNPNGDGRRTFELIRLNGNVRIENTATAPAAGQKDVYGATYIQKGVILAMEQFTAETNTVTVEDPVVGTLKRKPVLVLMSDGAPTVGTTDFTAPDRIRLGNGGSTSAALGFVSQLSAAYAKAKIEEKYGVDSLFYTLGLGLGNDSIAVGVLDPDHSSASAALDDFWNLDRPGNYYGQGAFKGYNVVNVGETVSLGNGLSVTKIATPLEQNYVDRYFPADGNAGDLSDALKKAFRDIVDTIQLQSGYYPTLVAENEDLSGYVSFVDKLGRYMEVTDVKGILIGDWLFSGAELASNFVPGGGSLGTFEDPTALGMEMVAAVRARLGLDSDDTARTLIEMAYEYGQLSYTDAENFSNYIGWYANASGQFLGFYNQGTTILPEATGDAATDPAFLVRSYGYLGAVDEEHGVSESDMMYATVQVREEIATGELLVTFAVPAALIPIVTYNVTLDETGALTDLAATGANGPISLVYEVSLNSRINAFNIRQKVSAEYLAENTDSNGAVSFYTNRWERANTTGYGTVNTYSYFNPSRQNDKYYYLEDAIVYADDQGTRYEGAQPTADMTLYRAYSVYRNNGRLRTETVYRPLSDAAKATAVQHEDGFWYIPKGNVHVNLEGYTVDKTENRTGTLSQANIPFVDTHNHSINDPGYRFYVGATLGNNGKLTLEPETGIMLSKVMAPGTAAPDTPFTFTIMNLTDPSDNAEYPAWLVRADGTETDIVVAFRNGTAAVELYAGDILWIGGMTANQVFRIQENETAGYIATAEGLSDSGTVTIEKDTIVPVTFINADRGSGDLTVTKEVKHDFGADYRIPDDKFFTVQVTLSGVGTANAVFSAAHTNGEYTEIATDENGRFVVRLKHAETFEVFGLPAGTVATVVETEYGAGFAPVYRDNGVPGDGIVTVVENSVVSVVVVNEYQAAEVYPVDIIVAGNKTLTGRAWTDSDSFAFVLQKQLPDGSWQQLGQTVTAVKGDTGFQFTEAFQNERYTAPGIYHYRVIELEPVPAIAGVTYDKTVHNFSVVVTDADMDGQLEIIEVKTDRPETTDVKKTAAGWEVFTRFHNTYSASGSATVTIGVNKHIDNRGGVVKSLAGFVFGLFDPDTGVQVGELLTTTERGFARFVLTYGASEVGTYRYILKEIAPDPVPSGWTYSTEEIPVTVEVTDNGDGTISAVVYTGSEKPEYVGSSVETDFTNIYDPVDAELTVDFVSKELTGRVLKAGEFTFEVQELDGTTVLRGTNDALGKVTFDGKLHFTETGTYSYRIVETSTDGNGIESDKTAYLLTVTVTDNGGALQASYTIYNAVEDRIVFRNVYTASPVEHSIRGNKTLAGRVLLNDEFTFRLTELTVDGAAVQEPRTWSVTNGADTQYNIVFPAITYDKAGTYTYRMEEVIPEGGTAYGIVYDRVQYMVSVVIGDDGEGNLYFVSETVTQMNGTPVNEALFLNRYTAKGTFAQFTGGKQLTGKVDNTLYGGEFEFELYDSNADWERLALRETVENGENGWIRFSQVDFDTAGDQYFIVVEKVPEGAEGRVYEGITYDDAVYRVWVQVTDDMKGQLHATVHIYDADGIPQADIRFVNTYETVGTDTVILSGEKILSGREFREDDSFAFELYETDEAYAAGKEPALTAEMDSETHRYQFALTYGAEDVGKTFYYIVRERNAGQTIDGISYSRAEYRIAVTVSDRGNGTIEAVAVAEDAEIRELNFTNVYTSQTQDDTENPKTGIGSHVAVWVAAMLISGGAVLTLCTSGKKKREIADS